MPETVPEAFQIGRTLSRGLEALQRQPLGLLVGAFLLVSSASMSGGTGGNFNFGDLADLDSDAAVFLAAAQLGLIAFGTCMTVVVWLFQSWLLPGYYRLHRVVLWEDEAPFSTLFSGGDAFGRMALWKLLQGVIALGVFALSFGPAVAVLGVALFSHSFNVLYGVLAAVLGVVGLLPFVYVQLGLVLGDRAVSLDGLGPIDALERSWDLVRGARIHLLAYFVLIGFFKLLGLVVFCMGYFVTRAVADAGVTDSYLRATRDDLVSSNA